MFGRLGHEGDGGRPAPARADLPRRRDRRGAAVHPPPQQRHVPAAGEGRLGRHRQGDRRRDHAAGVGQGDPRRRPCSTRPAARARPTRSTSRRSGSSRTSAATSRSTATTARRCPTSSRSATARAASASRPRRWSRAAWRRCTRSSGRCPRCPSCCRPASTRSRRSRWSGRTEEDLTEAGVPYVSGIARWSELARGLMTGDEDGMLKLLVSTEDRSLLGVHVLGTGAADLVHIGQARDGRRRAGSTSSSRPSSTTRRSPRPTRWPRSTRSTG